VKKAPETARTPIPGGPVCHLTTAWDSGYLCGYELAFTVSHSPYKAVKYALAGDATGGAFLYFQGLIRPATTPVPRDHLPPGAGENFSLGGTPQRGRACGRGPTKHGLVSRHRQQRLKGKVTVLWAWTVVGIPKAGWRGIVVFGRSPVGGMPYCACFWGVSGEWAWIMSGPLATPVFGPDEMKGDSE
jgi:hypothetical protein